MDDPQVMLLKDLFREQKNAACAGKRTALVRLEDSLRLIASFIRKHKNVHEVTVADIFCVVVYHQHSMVRVGIHGKPELRAHVHLGAVNLSRLQTRLQEVAGRTLVVTTFPERSRAA